MGFDFRHFVMWFIWLEDHCIVYDDAVYCKCMESNVIEVYKVFYYTTTHLL